MIITDAKAYWLIGSNARKVLKTLTHCSSSFNSGKSTSKITIPQNLHHAFPYMPDAQGMSLRQTAHNQSPWCLPPNDHWIVQPEQHETLLLFDCDCHPSIVCLARRTLCWQTAKGFKFQWAMLPSSLWWWNYLSLTYRILMILPKM